MGSYVQANARAEVVTAQTQWPPARPRLSQYFYEIREDCRLGYSFVPPGGPESRVSSQEDSVCDGSTRGSRITRSWSWQLSF